MLAGAAPLALGSGTLSITAVVAKFASVGVYGQPAALVVTRADIARGYIEIARGARLELASNSAAGMRLEFLNALAGGPVLGIEVAGMPGGGLIAGAARGISKSTYVIRYRIALAPAARPGIYPWPVQVVASPL